MALPVGGSDQFPPEDCQCYLNDARTWAAWWSGDLTELMSTSGLEEDGAFSVPTQERRFNMGPAQRRRFWQRRADSRDQTSAMRAVHAPLAGDICETSADLLFGEAPDLVAEGEEIPAPDLLSLGPAPDMITDPAGHQAHQAAKATMENEHRMAVAEARARNAAQQAAVEQIVEKVALWSRLLEGAETCAAVGGVYLRAAWDTDVADHPFTSVVEQDRAIPDFRWGRLVAVTFFEEVLRKGNDVWRHLERHEPGVILHGLYAGTPTTLGKRVSLTEHPSTAGLMDEVRLPAGLPRPLLVKYVPNVLPNRRHRQKPVGRSDLAGSETFLDSLDEVWTSLMRDVRLGQARLVTADEFLQPAGFKPGDGKTLDVDRELFTGLNIAEIEKMSELLKLIQPELRVAEHLEAVLKLVETIVSAAGYSPQTFGIDIEGQAESGTALRVREKKTLHTVKRKRGYWKSPIEEHVEDLMALDAALFGGPAPQRPRLDWPDLTDDPVERAQTTSLWHTAQAISLQERVRARNPHWDEDEIAAEVDRINEEKAAAMPMVDLPPVDEDEKDADAG